ncbi:MAG: PAS domain S-box protein [Pirellulaceae bacterium]
MLDFFDFCSEMLCVADHRGFFTRVNSAWTRNLGWSEEELTSRPYIEFVHPDDVEATLREATLLQTDSYETVHFQNRYRSKDGSYRWLAWQAKAKPDTGELLATARDVTDEHNQLEALRASEERFRSLATHAPIGIAQADRKGRLFYVNQQLCEMVGVRSDELLSDRWRKIVHEDDFAEMRQVWLPRLQAGERMPGREFRLTHRDGSLRWASCSIAPVEDSEGRPDGWIAIVQDIHGRKTFEHRLDAIFDQAPIGIAAIDSRTGRFLELNPRYAEILGRTQQEALQLDFQTVTHPDDLQEDLDQMALLVSGRIEQFRMEKRYLQADGAVRWVNLIVVPLWQPGEAPKQHLAIVEDITKRKLAEETLQTREAQLAGMLDNSSNVVYLKDRSGRYLLTNLRFQELFGKPESEIVGATDVEIFGAETARIFQDSDAKVWRDQAPHDFEETVSQEDGLHTYRSVKFPVKDQRGRMLAIGGISTDITDLTTAYADLAAKERLLRNLIDVQEREKQFICYEFHDGLVQYAAGSLMTLESLSTQQLSEKCATTINRVVADLRRGIEDGRRVIRGIRPTVLDDIGIRAALEDLIDQLPAAEIAVEFDFDPAVGRLNKTLEATIYRVVQEAVHNARKHSGSNRLRIALMQVDAEVEIVVQDFGCGFDVERSRKTGFGLLGVNERVRLLNGRCRIHSEAGIGTTITVRLPLAVADAVA